MPQNPSDQTDILDSKDIRTPKKPSSYPEGTTLTDLAQGESQLIPNAQEYKKAKEGLTGPEISVALNKEVFTELAQEYPQLSDMLETFQRLPGTIDFKRGVNFIFGKNGSGKSTLASAIYLLAKAAAKADDIKRNAVLDRDTQAYNNADQAALNDTLNPSGTMRYEVADLLKAGLAPEIVRRGAIRLTGFNQADSLPVDMLNVQDFLGEQKSREAEYLNPSESDLFYPDGAYKDLDKRVEKDTIYKKRGVSARQDLERKLTNLLEHRFPGSIVFLDEATMGLSPWRQEEYIRQLHKIAEERKLLIIAPENSGYAWEGPYNHIHLNEPEKGLQAPNVRQPEHTPVQPLKDGGEQLRSPSIEFRIDKDKLAELAQSHPRFAAMLETFQRLPDHLKFSHGKTEIYADNGDGKTTLLNTMYLLAKIERFAGGTDNDSPTPQEREESMDYILNSRQIDDKLFMQSSGLAAELIRSGAITLGDHKIIPEEVWSGRRAVEHFNLLDLSGEITNDTFNVVGYALEKGDGETALQKAQDFEKKYRPDRIRKSTRQTVESYLAKTIENEMLPGGFLFVDEIDGGISPDRQLPYSDQINKLAKEKQITIISTSNSYEGHQHPITPKLDLHDAPEAGIVPPRYTITSNA